MLRKTISLLLLPALLHTTVFAQKAKYVVLISIDGFRPDFYKNTSWPAVNLQQMARQGVYAEGVRGIFPSITYPSHTTLITGVPPAKHGIYYNMQFEPGDEGIQWYTEAQMIKSETLWGAVRKAGLTSASVSWPVSVGAPVDYNIPEIWNKDYPDDRRRATSENATPKGLYEEVVRYATGHMQMNDFNLSSLSMDENLSRIAGYLIRTYKPSLITIHLPCTDVAEHAEGRDGDLLRRAVAGADHAVSNILDALQKAGIKDSTAVIVTGDHGFVNTHSSLAPNVWLAKKGLIDIPGDKNDWKAWFVSTGGSAFLHLKNNQDAATLQQVKQLLQEISPTQKKLFRIIEKPELEIAGADPDAMLALTAVPGISFINAATGAELRPAKGGTHGHFPNFYEIQTGFIGFGAGFKKRGIIPLLSLEDVAPTVAALLGIQMSQSTGTVYPGLLEQPAK